MLARIRRSMQERDQGFTLIELLVVMIIIGILAAIAIPVFLNQRQRAVDSSIKSDLRNIASQMETVYTDSQVYVTPVLAAGVLTVGGDPVEVSDGNTFTYVGLAADGTAVAWASAVGFCLTGDNTGDSGTNIAYNSLEGGLQTGAGATCPAAP